MPFRDIELVNRRKEESLNKYFIYRIFRNLERNLILVNIFQQHISIKLTPNLPDQLTDP